MQSLLHEEINKLSDSTYIISVSSGELCIDEKVLGNNDCIIEVPPNAVTESGISIQLSTAFNSSDWPKGCLAITPVFQCHPKICLQREIDFQIPTWCETASTDITANLITNIDGVHQVEQSIQLEQLRGHKITFTANHFSNFCCFVKSSQIGLCSFQLSIHVFSCDKHGIVVIFHLADKTIQNLCEASMLKCDLVPVFAGTEKILVKYQESVNMSLNALNRSSLVDNYSISLSVDDEYLRTGYFWKQFTVPGIEIDSDTILTYVLNGESERTVLLRQN